jgi:hypothetical protein
MQLRCSRVLICTLALLKYMQQQKQMLLPLLLSPPMLLGAALPHQPAAA